MSQLYKVTAYAGVPHRNTVEVSIPLEGPAGPAGVQGSAGQGVPAGGATGYVLAKASAADYDADWVEQTGGGGGGGAPTGAAGGDLAGTYPNPTIANDAVSNAKLANMATATLKGRATANTGDPEDLSASQVRTILNVADGAQVNAVTSVAGRTGAVVLAVADVADAVATSDARLSDARTPTAHTHPASAITDFNTAAAAAAPVQSVNGNTGAVTVSVPSAATTTPSALGVAEVGTATAFARADHVHAMPSAANVGAAASSHTHGNLTNDGKLGSTAGLPLVTTAAGAVTTLALGTAGQVLQVNSGATGVEFAAASGGDTVSIEASAADVLSVSSGAISADDAGADRIVFWDDSASKLTHLSTVGPTFDGTTLRWPVELVIACSDETTDLATGTAKVTFRAPYAFTLTAVRASVNTAPTGSTLIVDINNGANSALSTKLSIDASEKTSTTATTAAVIDATYDDFSDDAEITIDIDQIGSTIAGKGLKVAIIGTRA